MSKISDIVDQIIDGNDVPAPELSKVVVRVRTNGDITPPSWLKSFKADEFKEEKPRTGKTSNRDRSKVLFSPQ